MHLYGGCSLSYPPTSSRTADPQPSVKGPSQHKHREGEGDTGYEGSGGGEGDTGLEGREKRIREVRREDTFKNRGCKYFLRIIGWKYHFEHYYHLTLFL